MFLQVFSVVILLELTFTKGSSLTGICQNNGCANGILDTAVELIRKGSNLSKKCGEENGAFCILDVAVDLIEKAKRSNKERTVQALDCEELHAAGYNTSGNYTIWPKSRVGGGKSMEVYCDMQTDGGGWTVIQRRGDFGNPKDYFYKNWSSYKSGFGDTEKEFWLGNDNIFALTNQKLYSVRFDLEAVDGEKRYALYDTFWIGDEANKYILHIEGYSGDAGDSMTYHNNMKFSTKDANNDNGNGWICATRFKGAWWYDSCAQANLNGMNLRGRAEDSDGMNWNSFRSYNESLASTEIKVRSKTIKMKSLNVS